MDSLGLDHDKMDKVIRETLSTAHGFKPDDQRAVFVFDAQKQFSQFGILTCVKGPARLYWNGDARHRWRRSYEHHAGFGNPAYSRNRRGKSPEERAGTTFVSVPGRGDGNYRGQGYLENILSYAYRSSLDASRSIVLWPNMPKPQTSG